MKRFLRCKKIRERPLKDNTSYSCVLLVNFTQSGNYRIYSAQHLNDC